MSPNPENEPVLIDISDNLETPPRKMKQARLPFAPVNNKTPKSEITDSGRKRKLSDKEDNITPSKTLKKDPEVSKREPEVLDVVGEPEILSKENNPEKKPAEKAPKEVKPKKKSKKSIESNTDNEKSNSELERSDKFYGLLKMPFKKSNNSDKAEVVDVDECSVELMNTSADGVISAEQIEEPATVNEEETSMTEEWAKFHEKDGEAGNEEKPTEIIKTPKSVKKTKEEKEKEKLERESAKKLKGRKRNVSKGKKAMLDESNAESKEVESKVKENCASKNENPLTKFLVKGKFSNSTSSPTSVKPSAGSNETEIIESKEQATEAETAVSSQTEDVSTSTPLRRSPRKSVSGRKSSPFDPERMKQVAIAKLKVEINVLSEKMDKAVQDKDFLAAHEAKQEITKLEEQIAEKGKENADLSFVNPSLEQTIPIEEKEKLSNVDAADDKLSKSMSATPKRGVSVVSTPGSGNVSSQEKSNASTPGSAKTTPNLKKLTPGQLAKREEALKKKEALIKERQEKKEALEKEKEDKRVALEKEKQLKKEALAKEKEDKEKLKLEEKAKKDHEKEVERRAKEVERMEKEREKKMRDQEKEEERLKKKAEKDAEQKQKEEERLKKEEEKRKLEEAEKEKNLKKAQTFKSFFTKDEEKEKRLIQAKEEVEGTSLFTQFRVKENMRIAPLVRADPKKAKDSIDSLESPSGPDGLYLNILKTCKTYIKRTMARTWPYERKEEDEVTILDDGEEEDEEEGEGLEVAQDTVEPAILKAKLLKFHENQRPAYWGTWSKKSSYISGRKPFGLDRERFDYDYDSDEEWEEEEEGESLSDNEDDKEEVKESGEDDYEVDNDFFVPHGHLSDEEQERDDDEVFDPEKEKVKLKFKEQEFEAEQKKKNKKKVPRTLGVFYEGDTSISEAATSQLIKILGMYSGLKIGNNNTCIETGFSAPESGNGSPECGTDVMESGKGKGTKTKGVNNRSVPTEALPFVAKLVHGNPNNKHFLAKEFIEFWNRKKKDQGSASEDCTPSGTSSQGISKRQMVKKIDEIAEYKADTQGSGRKWMVKEDVLKDLEEVSAVNSWEYILEPPNCTQTPGTSRPASPNGKGSSVAAPSPANLITKFTKILSAEEKEQLRIKQEKEAAELREKREAKRKLDEVAASQVVKEADDDVEVLSTTVATPTTFSGIAKFTKVLTAEEKAKSFGKAPVKKSPKDVLVAVDSPKAAKRKSAGCGKDAKTLPIKRATNAKSGGKVSSPSPLTFKKNLSTLGASPIAVKRKPNVVANMPSDLKSAVPVRASPRKKIVEEIPEVILD